jgi:hypothetical protein
MWDILMQLFKISFYLGFGVSVLLFGANVFDFLLNVFVNTTTKFIVILSKVFG